MSSVSAEGFDVIRYMPPPTRRALAVVAAGGASRQVMVDAMRRLGVDPGDLRPALEAGIIYERGPRIDFRHQLVRSVAFHRAPLEVRQAVRGALSDVLAESQAIEASAYHASVDVVAPDEMAARRLVEAARVALDRGDPASAARNEELAARCAPAADAAGRHLADAANHWQAAGERERAQYCVDSGAELDVSDPVAAELSYQRARLAGDRDEGAADQMVEAAEACLADRPHRALAMLVDAAAWQVLANRPGDAEAIADRAVRAAGSVSSHSEVLARTVRAAATLARGGVIDEIAERSHVSLLIGQTERFPSSPEVALVIGLSLGQQGLRRQAERWAEWIGRCAEQCGDRALAVVPPLLAGSYLLTDGRLAQAEEAVLAGTAAAEDAGSLTMVAWGWHLAVLVHTLAGRYERGFAASAQLFALADRIGGLARLRTLPVLALLELARGHTAAAAAWARTAEEEILLHAAGGVRTSVEAVVVDVAPVVSTVFLLARRPADAATWVALIEADGSGQPVPAACRSWLRGACAGDARAAVEELAEVSHAYRDEPFRRALVDLCWAARLVDAGMVAESALRLDDLEQRMRAVGAEGLVALVDRERTRLPAPRPGAAAPAPAPAPLLRPVPAEPHSGWEISLLGGFAIRNKGQLVTLPASLAAQAVKIVALHPRITVDELIECLWEDAEPGVGQRRLRNVLWRIRSACGDLLVRDGNFVRLAPEAVTDLARFRSSADDALVGPNAGTTAGVDSARQALECYRGELLPGDRYADWAAATRESVARTYLRLLDVLVEDALAGDRQGEALVLLERLAEVDPFDERHHLRVAEIHLEAGNRGRALDALERAESMLADLRVAPSPEVRRLREALDRP